MQNSLAMASYAQSLKITPSEFGSQILQYQETMIQWLQNNWFQLAAAILIAALFYAILSWLRAMASRIDRNSGDRFSLKAITARTVSRTGRFFRIMLAIELVNSVTNAPNPIGKIITTLFIIAIAIQVAVWVREIILGLIERRAGQGEHEHETLTSAMVLIRLLVSFAVFAIAAIFILDNLGVNVTGLVAGLGIGGIAIGLAAQGIFSDLFAAIAVIFDRPFKRGDIIRYDTTQAIVEKIGMKSTRLRSLTGEEIIISNSKLLEKEITNVSGLEYRRTTYNLSIIYQTPPEKARAIPALLQEIVETEGAVFIRAGFTGFGDSALLFQLVFDMDARYEFEEVFAARHRIGLNILSAFAAKGYEFAYPTQTTFTAAPDGSMIMPYAMPRN
jgi:small-conductance mechanosensitive channel